MTTIRKWTGRESRALREAMRLSVRDFAEQLGISDRAISKWEAGGADFVPRPDSQAILDTKLRQVSDEVRTRFNLLINTESDSAGTWLPTVLDTAQESPFSDTAPERPWHLPTIVASDGFGLNIDDEERVIRAVRKPTRADPSIIVPLKKILAAQRETEDLIGSAPLIKPVTGQLATLEDLVTESRGPTRAGLIDIAAQWAEYSGWLHTSIGDWQEARAWLDRAFEWAVEADNSTLSATALSFKGHLAYLLGQIGPMIGLTQAALRDSSSWVGQRAYDAHQLARGLALAGDSEEAVRKVEEGRSLALLADEQSDEKPPWIYYYTLPFYALERGLVYRFLGRDNATYNDEAIASLTAALSDLGEARSSEWAAEYIYHLAIAYMQAGSPDEACEAATEVLRVARATESRRLMERLNGIYARLVKRWPDDSRVRELGEALR